MIRHINIEVIIEHIQDMGFVDVGQYTTEEIKEIKATLRTRGYNTYFQSTSRDLLILEGN